MLKEILISSVLALAAGSSVLAQTPRRAVSSPTTPAQKPNIVTAPSSYSWQIRPSVADGYFSSDIPQPVCAYVNGVPKIFIFTNFAYYPSMNLQNQSNAVRVGEITAPADTYQLLPHSLPGARQEFAATSILKSGNDHTIYIFGGKNASGEPWTWGNIQAWILTDNYSGPNNGQGKLTAAPYNNAARARDMAGAVKCGNFTYLVGGTYGHGPTFQDRGMLVDRLSNNIYGPVESQIKSTSIF